MPPTKPHITLYTDGSCRGNPGPGGWAVLLLYQEQDGQQEYSLSGYAPDTTNNRMELQAVIEGIRSLKHPCVAQIYTDSQYVQKGISEWLSQWKRKGWITAAGKPVKNKDLWQTMDQLVSRADYEWHWHWVRGHSGHVYNERVDALARAAIP
jgi:ribonuclease HI